MDKPTTKTELLALMRAERAQWEELIANVGAARMGEPDAEGSWSVRDIIAHLTAYERWIAARAKADLRGTPPTNFELFGRADAPPETKHEDEYNAWVVTYHRNRPWRDVITENRDAYQNLLEVIEVLSEEELKAPKRFEWLRGKSLWEILPNQSYNHYAMRIPSIHAWLDPLNS